MQKQIIYCSLVPRIFSITIDLVIISIVLTPLMSIISKSIFIYSFSDFFQNNGIDTNDIIAMRDSLVHPDFVNYFSFSRALSYLLSIFTINTFFIGAYFVFFWTKYGTTPGKIMLKMKVVDADTMNNPSLSSSIKRFCGYITALIGMWSVIFTKKGMAMHDKIANTIVIKS